MVFFALSCLYLPTVTPNKSKKVSMNRSQTVSLDWWNCWHQNLLWRSTAAITWGEQQWHCEWNYQSQSLPASLNAAEVNASDRGLNTIDKHIHYYPERD